MGHGQFQYFDATVASFATLSSEVDLGKAFNNVYLEVPTMTSNTQLHIQAANASGGTFRRIHHPVINSSTTAAPAVYSILSSTTNAMIPIPAGFRYLKVETTAVVSFSAAFRIVCGD